MRNLTIKRQKNFANSLGKMKVCIEDGESSDIRIGTIPCRMIGSLKNGEEKTFQVDTRAAKIFVIADRVSKSFCNDMYELPEGYEDVYLTGKNSFNPLIGNSFRFDNNNSPAVKANRRKNLIIGMVVALISFLIFFSVGFLIGDVASDLYYSQPTVVEEKTFTEGDLSITLTNEFSNQLYEGYTVCFESQKVAVFALEEPFSLAEGFGDYTLEEYAEIVFSNNGMEGFELLTDGENSYFEYEFTNPDTQDTFYYKTYLYKEDDAFWVINFATFVENYGEFVESFDVWASSVEFD